MTSITDDPTSYLKRDIENPVVILAPNVVVATAIARQYGVAIQVNGPDPTQGIRVVTTEAEARQAVSTLPASTPWAVIPKEWSLTTYQILAKGFGPPQTMDKALAVRTEGIAWNPNRMIV
jgi:hypothetical protein